MSAHMVPCPRCAAREAEKLDQVCEWCHGSGEVDANETAGGGCEQAKERCDCRAVVVVREAPPGNPYRELKVCCAHADEMVASGLYFLPACPPPESSQR